ncbi:hypothetical protein [Streptomyces californicus]|uniref:hypothetical protein n=1 Tax=Streptomyces californicus TaxID=67351 RepID=UPI0037BB7F16
MSSPRTLDQATRTRALAEPIAGTLVELPGGTALAEQWWPHRDRALAAYAAQLAHTDTCSDTLLRQLVRAHLHLGLDDPADRATAWRLARSTALRHRAAATQKEARDQ